MEYMIIVEDAGANFAAYAPEVPGCIATGKTVAEVTDLFREALTAHLADLAKTGQPLPLPASRAATVDVALSAGAARVSHARGVILSGARSEAPAVGATTGASLRREDG